MKRERRETSADTWYESFCSTASGTQELLARRVKDISDDSANLP